MAVIFTALILASIIFLPLTYAIFSVIGLVILAILVDAMGNRILFKMSVRNVIRRPSTTALVLGGLMVGTAIISASLIVGDTLDNMIVGETVKGYADMDFSVGGRGPGTNTTGFYNYSEVLDVQAAVANISHVDGSEWSLWTSGVAWDVRSNLSLPSVTILGMTNGLVRDFGGFIAINGTAVSELPQTGMAYVNQKLADKLEIRDGDAIYLVGRNSSLSLTAVIVQNEKVGAWDANVFIELGQAQSLNGNQGMVNSLVVSADEQGRAEIGTVRGELNTTINGFPDDNLRITNDRAKAIETGRDNVQMFTSLFFVFGSFSIIAGIALIINIFTMLGEERKGEMGVARAVGMKRAHLQKLFTYEGLMYAAIAAAIGTGVGLVLAYLLILAAGSVIPLGDIAIDRYFTFTSLSLALAYLAGFILTLVTVFFVTRRISFMNIVRAVRNIPEPGKARDDKGLMRLGLITLAVGFLVMALGMNGKTLALAMSGLSLMTISIGLLLRRFTGDRIAWTVAGLVTLFLWMPTGIDIFPYSSNIEMFVVAGVFMVTSLLIVVMFNSDSIVGAVTRVLRARGSYTAVIKTAVSYPLRARVRTALSIFIFGLVIFTVTTLSMMSGVLSVGIPKMIDETSGGFDVIAFSSKTFDMWGEINTTSGLVEKGNISDIVQLSSGYAVVTATKVDKGTGQAINQSFYYNAIGLDSRLMSHYPLSEWNSSIYATEEEVYRAAMSNSSLVIIDGTASQSSDSGMGVASFSSSLTSAGIGLGSTMVMTDHQGGNHTVTVIGVMKQAAFNAVFLDSSYVRDQLGTNGTNLFLIKMNGDLDSDKQAILLQNQFREMGVSTIAMKALAKQVVSQIDGIFNLIKAFLALGLIIGITGLGIITIRSIHERRIEIGMMRAIGYTKRMVVTNFALESAFVSVLGILIGTSLGMVVGFQLWETGFRSMGFDFVIAWEPILLVGVLAFLATLLSVYPAARGASKVSPADVLRFE